MRISDWSSDVCSSDLEQEPHAIDDIDHRFADRVAGLHHLLRDAPGEVVLEIGEALAHHVAVVQPAHPVGQSRREARSEERRVGKEGVSTGRFGWSLNYIQKNK